MKRNDGPVAIVYLNYLATESTENTEVIKIFSGFTL